MTISMDIGAASDGDDVVQPCRIAATGQMMLRRSSVQPSRRAVLHVQAAGDSAMSADLMRWYTERAFQFYLAGVRIPPEAVGSGRARAFRWRRRGQLRWTGTVHAAFADLDAAAAQLRDAEGFETVIVTAFGRAALAAALWAETRQFGGADALILHEPALPAHRALKLSIGCPVLVLTSNNEGPGVVPRASRTRHASRPALLGNHVTWLQLPGNAGRASPSDGADCRELFSELGRWLGAYMYGQLRDQLL